MTQAGLCIKTVFTSLSIASKYLESFMEEIKPEGNHKRFLQMQLQKIISVERDMRLRSSDQQSAEIIRQENSANWEVLAVNNVLLMTVDMDDEYKQKAEEAVEALYTQFITEQQKRRATLQLEQDDNRSIG